MRNFLSGRNKLKLFVLLGTVLVAGFLFWGTVGRAELQDGGVAPLRQEQVGRDELVGETPVITKRLDQAAIDDGRIRFRELFEAGEDLFIARFNLLDGEGRPAATGNGIPSPRAPRPIPEFIQSSGPTANSCAGCHFQPGIGGGGDFAVSVHVLANNLDPPVDSFAPEFGDERNSLGLQGGGVIELLAREMTVDLHAIREQAIGQAQRTGQAATLALVTKGVNFGQITALPNGTLNTDGVQGVDRDLIIKPFHQKGVVVSLREFSNNAMNHHLGIQTIERFGAAQTGINDFDQDGVPDELTAGDVTAVTIWQAALGIPGRVIPTDPRRRRAMERGERVFNRVGCAQCHLPSLVLNNPVFTEPNPFNPPGNLRPEDVPNPFVFDLTRQGLGPRLERQRNGRVIVRAFTDLKRHVIGDQDFPHFLNERVIQAGVPTDQFLTRKLWDVGNSAGYGHRGDLTTISEAILNHGGEGRSARDAFTALPQNEQAAVIEFLKSLQILPDGVASLTLTDEEVENILRRRRGRLFR